MQSRIEEDLKASMKSGDKRRVATLRLLLASLKNEKIQAQRDLTGEEVEAVLRRAVKQRRDSIEQYARGGRQDLVDAETAELAIIEEYLPRGLSDAEIEAELRGIIAEKGFASAKDVGLAMKEVMARHRGRVDGKKAQEIARRLLP
ncbi:MAG TPA: GatB/YqeY domain-containing protein [Thermoanaerobaculia bacterium]